MANGYKTPGVYVAEVNAFPHSAVAVTSAVPAFIGHTGAAEYQGRALRGKPRRISSLAEFHACFGFAPRPRFSLDDAGRPVAPATLYRLYHAMRLFFQNGGEACHVVSAGSYSDELSATSLVDALRTLEAEQEPTLVVVPDAISLATLAECAAVQNEVLAHCANTRNRFAILDVYQGYKSPAECIAPFRATMTDHLSMGAAYYPWLKTTAAADDALSFANFTDIVALQSLLADEASSQPEPRRGSVQAEIARLSVIAAAGDAEQANLHRTLSGISPRYVQLLQHMRDQLNLQPPSGAIAGVYTSVDNSIGVWKAPANVSVNAVLAPAVSLSHEEQEDLNVPVDGKAVNAIRTFPGKGTLVWGARTLDGNNQDWRYVNVRRTVMMIEESIRLALQAYVFEPNAASTWATIRGMVRNFLTGIWTQGGLAGATADEAFAVHVGLGATMTDEDIDAGRLRMTVLLAVVRPAEFIALAFEQQQQST